MRQPRRFSAGPTYRRLDGCIELLGRVSSSAQFAMPFLSVIHHARGDEHTVTFYAGGNKCHERLRGSFVSSGEVPVCKLAFVLVHEHFRFSPSPNRYVLRLRTNS